MQSPLPTRRMVLAASLAAATVPAQAQSWPTRPVRVIVPFPPGGATDFIARLVAEALGPVLGQQVFVENRGGAYGMLGMQAAATAEADGYTLAATAPGVLAVNQFVLKRMSYDPERDLRSVSMIASIPYVMVVPSSVPARSVAEFVDLVKRNPGRYNFGTSGMSSRLTVELFRALAGGLDMTMVQYRGGGPQRVDLLRGDLHVVIDQLPSFLEDFEKGVLVPLAISTPTRSPMLPNVPTMIEAGIAGYEAAAWLAYSAPRATPTPVITRLNTAIDEVLRRPEIVQRLATWGATPVGGSPEHMDSIVTAERIRWQEAVRVAGIEPE
ncbi:Bug family tripartite tricarboxylate transporter substrate binding protein [Humitalea sp. 24SJ18S-53]|uniref:Bug family tripartite tricarboxylate transporter substrate binding protein n=1 Tax=Humitalea sp. 24SJ18S-53 TaxID=3422307 RepID=UPI003D66822E